ncbi:MAG: HAD family hydrolase, partial [Muribaculaceae bacterium]|nr:HAD family hydrolase [Muribaculaceae bacterium]
YVTDLDGTLLNGESRVIPVSAAMLTRLAEAGVMVTPATARTPATVQPLMRNVGQAVYRDSEGEVRPLPAIVMTGAGMWNRADARFDSCELIPQEDAMRIRDTFAKAELRPFVYCLSGDSFINVYHSAAMTRRENSFYQERRRLTLKRFHLDQTPARWDRVALFFAIGPVGMVEKVTGELAKVTDCAAAWYPDIIMPDTGLIDLYAPGVSKARAVKELAAKTGAREVVVFGDNLNDLPMMRVADVAVAMENALPEVKAEADVVIGRNTEDAVPRFIMEREGIG